MARAPERGVMLMNKYEFMYLSALTLITIIFLLIKS